MKSQKNSKKGNPMTSKLKCPFCNSELVGTIACPYCRNEKCEMCDEMLPRELLDLLDSTRKELEIAKNGLRRVITKTNSQVVRGFEYIATGIAKVAKDTLKQIEHKE